MNIYTYAYRCWRACIYAYVCIREQAIQKPYFEVFIALPTLKIWDISPTKTLKSILTCY